MNNCKNCDADPQVCEYCIYKKNKNSINNSDNNEKIIYYYNMKDDNTSQKVCCRCKKIFTDYPAISRKDNKSLICSECGMKEIQEPLEELLNNYGIEIY